MSNIQQSILDAIEILSKKYIQQAHYNRTIQAQIISCINKKEGKYRCRYQDSVMQAYSSNLNISYKENSWVYILIPQNDMQKKKIILCTIGNKEDIILDYDIEEIQQQIEELEKNFELSLNYINLINKPKIQGYQLIGNKSFAELGMIPITIEQLDEILI